MPRFGWPEKHGEKRREEIREFRREEAGTLAKSRMEEAGALAKSRMAETEREQVGATRRRGLLEAGAETRHLREFGPEGVRAREVGLRYAPGGLAERGQIRRAETAGERLSDVMRGREEKKATGIYAAETERLLTPFLEGVGEEAVLPERINILRLEADVAEARKPGAGFEMLQKGIKEYEEDQSFLESLQNMPLSELEALRTPAGARLGGF
jgi:hypothetical protein